MNRGAARGGFYHNTGEGGISRFHLSGGDVVWNVGTGYFGCGKTIDDKGTRAFCPDQFKENATKEQVKDDRDQAEPGRQARTAASCPPPRLLH